MRDERRDALLAALCEGLLILAAGLSAYLIHQPLFFASLGPTAFEIAEMPERPSAKPYGVIVGHAAGVLCGFFAVWITHAGGAPRVSEHSVAAVRVAAAVLSTVLTVLLNAVLRSAQPAALATTLLIATGSMRTMEDGASIMAAVLLMAALGEPLRRWRIRTRQLQKLAIHRVVK